MRHVKTSGTKTLLVGLAFSLGVSLPLGCGGDDDSTTGSGARAGNAGSSNAAGRGGSSHATGGSAGAPDGSGGNAGTLSGGGETGTASGGGAGTSNGNGGEAGTLEPRAGQGGAAGEQSQGADRATHCREICTTEGKLECAGDTAECLTDWCVTQPEALPQCLELYDALLACLAGAPSEDYECVGGDPYPKEDICAGEQAAMATCLGG